LKKLGDVFEGSLFFFLVFMLEFAEWVLQFWHWGNRPVVGWEVMFIYGFITAA
jgi:hypothetical protein